MSLFLGITFDSANPQEKRREGYKTHPNPIKSICVVRDDLARFFDDLIACVSGVSIVYSAGVCVSQSTSRLPISWCFSAGILYAALAEHTELIAMGFAKRARRFRTCGFAGCDSICDGVSSSTPPRHTPGSVPRVPNGSVGSVKPIIEKLAHSPARLREGTCCHLASRLRCFGLGILSRAALRKVEPRCAAQKSDGSNSCSMSLEWPRFEKPD